MNAVVDGLELFAAIPVLEIKDRDKIAWNNRTYLVRLWPVDPGVVGGQVQLVDTAICHTMRANDNPAAISDAVWDGISDIESVLG